MSARQAGAIAAATRTRADSFATAGTSGSASRRHWRRAFVSGDDPAAKATVTALLQEFGRTDVIDLGDLSTARGTELPMPIRLRLWGGSGTAAFNFKIVR